MPKCCYCKKAFKGKVVYAIPEGFPNDKRHDGKPLCNRCGSQPTPTLDEICEKLDREQRKKDARKTNAFRGGIFMAADRN